MIKPLFQDDFAVYNQWRKGQNSDSGSFLKNRKLFRRIYVFKYKYIFLEDVGNQSISYIYIYARIVDMNDLWNY